jgi:hypothetical protein
MDHGSSTTITGKAARELAKEAILRVSEAQWEQWQRRARESIRGLQSGFWAPFRKYLFYGGHIPTQEQMVRFLKAESDGSIHDPHWDIRALGGHTRLVANKVLGLADLAGPNGLVTISADDLYYLGG